MSNTPQILPEKITKPIQLLAAWLAGLTVVNASFLTAAGILNTPEWLPALLTIAAVVNVPLFITSLFLLQTRFRPEMQEDTFYSKYLERKYSSSSVPLKPVDLEKQFGRLANNIVSQLATAVPDKEKEVVRILKDSEIEQMVERFRDTRTLYELYFHPDGWPVIHAKFREDTVLQSEIASLSVAGLIFAPDGVVARAHLTELGHSVAQRLEANPKQWPKLDTFRSLHDRDFKDLKDGANNRLQATTHKLS